MRRRTATLLALAARRGAATRLALLPTARYSVVGRADTSVVGRADDSVVGLRAMSDFAADGPTTTPEERAAAAALRTSEGAAAPAPATAAVEACVLGQGIQKYVLVQAGDRYFVRGDPRAAYHKDAALPLINELRNLGVAHEVLGGGRIVHDPANQQIKIYGHSFGFPWQGACVARVRGGRGDAVYLAATPLRRRRGDTSRRRRFVDAVYVAVTPLCRRRGDAVSPRRPQDASRRGDPASSMPWRRRFVDAAAPPQPGPDVHAQAAPRPVRGGVRSCVSGRRRRDERRGVLGE